jgi:TrmH family RNA methyltransferase
MMLDWVAMQNTLDRLRPVSSRQNALLKELRRAFARAEPTNDGYIGAEGVHLLEEAIRSGLHVKAVLFSESARNRAQRLLPQLAADVETVVVADDVFSSAVPTETPQGVAALVKLKSHSLEEVTRAGDWLAMLCVGIQDPGNLGTVIRSAEAFGASCVLLGEGTVSPFNSKAVRAAAGSLFRLPVLKMDFATAKAQLQAAGAKLLATSSHHGTPLSGANLAGKVVVVIGSEGAGLSRELLRQMDEVVTIPHSPKVESLNAAMAASVVLYEAARQRNYFSPLRHGGTEEK